MKSQNKIALSALALTGVLFAAFPPLARAQSIYIQDIETTDELALNLAEIQYFLNGNSRYAPGGIPASDTYNTNHLSEQVMFELGGPYFNPAVTLPAYAAPFANFALDVGIGSASDSSVATNGGFFNTNTLLQNALLGTSAKGVMIGTAYIGSTQPGGMLNVTPDVTMLGTQEVIKWTQMESNQKLLPPTLAALQYQWNWRCKNDFNPVYPLDPEGKLNSDADCKSLGSGNDQHWREDRSLSSLLDPLQYPAPDQSFMYLPNTGGHIIYTVGRDTSMGWDSYVYLRFQKKVADATGPAKAKDGSDAYYPIYAADSFCENLGMQIFASLSSNIDKSAPMNYVGDLAMMESIDSKIVSNCWKFFEERVQYPPGYPQHATQENQCKADYENLHIITQAKYNDCKTQGRSNLKSRADRAYRLDSEEYIRYLNTLGVATKETLIGMALGEPEKFEQSLLLERQIITETMSTGNFHGWINRSDSPAELPIKVK